MKPHAEVIAIETLGDAGHEVVIDDPVAQMLADLFLPPDGTRISGADLRAAVGRLVDATNALKRLDKGEVQ